MEAIMKDLALRKKLLLVTYACALLFVVLKFDMIRDEFRNIMHILSPFFLGIVIAFILNKPMMFFEKLFSKKIKKKGTSRVLAITVAYLLFLLLITAIITFIVPQIAENVDLFISRTNIYVKRMEEWVSHITEKYNIVSLDIQEVFIELNGIIKNLASWILNYIGDIVPRIISVTTNIVAVVFQSVITIVFSINLLASKERIFRQLKELNQAYLPEKIAKSNVRIGRIVNDIFGKYLIGQVTEACILGGLCFIGMKIFRFDYAVLISTLIAVTALIPVAGAWIGGGVSFILLGLISPINAVMFLIYFNVLQQLENNLIYPRVVGSSIGLPAIWVIFAVTVGGGLFGFAGIMVSVPTMSVIYTLIKENVNNRLKRKKKESVIEH